MVSPDFVHKQRITDEKILCIIFIIIIGLFFAGGCESKEDKALEAERQQIRIERISLLVEISHKCDTTYLREGPEPDFWWSLNKEQQTALNNFIFAIDGNVSKAARRKSINKMIKLLTPGMMTNLAEITKKREQFFSEKCPIYRRKMNLFKEKETSYCSLILLYEKQEESANWGQASIYYNEIKGKVFHKDYQIFGRGELLFDLHNARLATESAWEPEE
jgi:hypothetical protein